MRYYTRKELGARRKKEIYESVCDAFFLELTLWSIYFPGTMQGATEQTVTLKAHGSLEKRNDTGTVAWEQLRPRLI